MIAARAGRRTAQRRFAACTAGQRLCGTPSRMTVVQQTRTAQARHALTQVKSRATHHVDARCGDRYDVGQLVGDLDAGAVDRAVQQRAHVTRRHLRRTAIAMGPSIWGSRQAVVGHQQRQLGERGMLNDTLVLWRLRTWTLAQCHGGGTSMQADALMHM